MALTQMVKRILGEAASSLGAILRDGGRTFVQNWPLLFAIFFIGSAFRGAFVWLAVEASNLAPLLGMLLLPFAPVSLLIAMVLMLRSVAPGLPELQSSLVAGGQKVQLRSDLTVAVMVLVPFLAVYASQGLMKEDLRSFLYSATADEWMNQGFQADFSRVIFATDSQMLMIVIVALVLRKVIAGFKLAKDSLPIAGFAGYLEALWLVTLASFFAWSIDSVSQWVYSRIAVQEFLSIFDSIVAALGPIGSAIKTVINQVTGFVSSAGALVIVPVAWIAVGATIYGSSLPGARPLLTSEQMTQRLQQIPNPVRRLAAQVSEPVVNPFRNTLKAIGRIATAGVIPMVLLCIVFALTSQLRVLVTQGLRLLIGPHPEAFWVAFTPHIDLIAQSVYTTVMVSLLAASVNTVMASQRRAQEAASMESALEQPSEAPAQQIPAQT